MKAAKWCEPVVIAGVTALGAGATLIQAAFLHELNYNEGWNVYNAIAYRQHALYPPRLGFTSNNYPMLSFALLSGLQRLTHDYLYTARAVSFVSLLVLAWLVVQISRLLGATPRAGRLAGFFCFAVFTINTTGRFGQSLYVGADDPTMLALSLAALGLYCYLLSRERARPWLLLAISAFVFAAGLSVKHTLLDVAAVALLDALIRSGKRAVFFGGALVLFLTVSLAWHTLVGGAGFLLQLTAPRTYEGGRATETFINVFGPMLMPSLAAFVTAWLVRGDAQQRIAAWLLLAGLLLGCYTGSAAGVTYNCFFSAVFALCLLIGIFITRLQQGVWSARLAATREWIPTLLFAWFAVPLILFGSWNLVSVFQQAREEQVAFKQQVMIIQGGTGPALCESLLRCYFAGQPYTYDPFNATRLIDAGKLRDDEIKTKVIGNQYGMIELSDPVGVELTYRSEHFTPGILHAIQAGHVLVYQEGRESIYRPR